MTTVTGQKTGPVDQGWAALLDKHNTATNSLDPNTVCANNGNPNNIPEGDPLLVTVPVGDISQINGSKPMTVLGFAEVYLTGIDSKKATISGCFVQAVNTKTIGGNGTAPALGAVPPVALLQ
jgi:hypothetical protein